MTSHKKMIICWVLAQMMAAYSWQMYLHAAMQNGGTPVPVPVPFMPPMAFMHPDMAAAFGYPPFDWRKRGRDWDPPGSRRRRRTDNKVGCCSNALLRDCLSDCSLGVLGRPRLPASLIDPVLLAEQVCSNCQTSCTPFWRKDRHDGSPLCNACGLYYAKNESHRPKVRFVAYGASVVHSRGM